MTHNFSGECILEYIVIMIADTFGDVIRRRRLEKKLPLREVAAAIHFDQSLLSKIERNKMVAPAKIISPLSTCLDLDYKRLQIQYLSERLYKQVRMADFSLESLDLARKRIEQEHANIPYESERATLIRKIKDYFSTKPIEKVWIFGSFARKEEQRDSDIDLIVRFISPNTIDLFDYIGMRHDLEDLTGRPIDLIEEGQVVEKIKPIIEREKLLIYER